MIKLSGTLISVMLLAGCSFTPTANIEKINNTNNQTILKVSNRVNGANVSVIMNIHDKFSTKATANGTPSVKVTDINNLKLYLVTSDTDPLAAASIIFQSGILSYTGGASQIFTFSNVPPGGPYFIAVELFSDSSGTNNLIEPITYGGTTGTRGLTVSSGTVPSVTVDSNNSVSHNNALTLSPILRAGVGATIDANIAPQNGPSTTGNIFVN